jgi:hypothetical protein
MKMMKNFTPNFLSALQLVGICFIASKANKGSALFQKICLLFFLPVTLFLSATNINAQTQFIPIYLTDPSQALDRIDPVATADATTASTQNISIASPGVVLAAVTTGSSNNPGSTIFTVAHTTGSGYSRLMLVGISNKNKLINSVTYGGTPLTWVGESISNGNAHMFIYRLVNPPTGTANVVVTLAANPDKGIVVGVSTFTGVNQITPLGTFASVEGKSTLASVNISSAAGELVYDVVSFRNATISASGGQTVLYNINSGGEVDGGGASTQPGGSTVTMSWTGASSQDWAIGGVSIKPAPALSTVTFTQVPALCSPLTIKAGNTITVTNYVSVVSGVMPANPNITAIIKYGSTVITTLTNPTYNSGTGLLTWTGSLGSDVTVPTGQAIAMEVTCLQPGVTFNIQFDSQTKPSKINLPVSTYINVNSVNVYDAPYPGGNIITGTVGGTTKYIRTVVSNPFGYNDITSANVTITPSGTTYTATSVGTSGCIRTFEYTWAVPATPGTYNISSTAKQGLENNVTHTGTTNIDVCVDCPPSAINDTASGPGGVPVTVNVLGNDSDPNNNINSSSLTIITQPRNGTAIVSNGKIVYIPNGTFSGIDTVVYRICDLTSPTPLCAIASVFITIDATVVDPCLQATRQHIYYLPYPEQDAYTALVASSNQAIPSNDIRTVISIKTPYPGMLITWDEWEDGYETDINSPTQATTKVWGDGDIYNGIAPGFPFDIIPAGGSIILDNTMTANPRNPAIFYYDGKDKIVSSGQIAMTQVCGEPTWMPVQAMKTNLTSTYDFGQSFTIPFGQNFNSKDFAYTALFIRAAENNTTVNIDKDNNGTFETTFNLNEGGSYLLNGGVLTGATVTSNKPVGVEINAGGIDDWSIRNAPIFPATWYSDTYYTPVPTSDNAADNPKDSSVVMLYNSLNRSITINWSSGVPSSGTITIPAKSAVRFPLVYSATAAYKFVNPTGESFNAIEIIDSYTPGGGGNSGTTYDWSFNLISELRLTDYATVAWAPGGLDLIAPSGPDVNGNPIWVTPNVTTTIYVKYDGNITGSSGLSSPCGLKYDVLYNVNALNYIKIKDPSDNDQSGIAVYTCNGAKISAVYGEDPQGSGTGVGVAYWDVGSTIQPFCKQKIIFAVDDYAKTLVNQPVTIPILKNDYGFLATIDPASVSTIGLLQPKHGTVIVNSNGTVLYTPNTGFVGIDTFQYQVCSTPSPIVCDLAYVYVQITNCPSANNENIISGQVFLDKTKDGINNDGGTGFYPAKGYLYTDGNCNSTIDANELTDSVSVDNSGTYQFIKDPEKTVFDDFDGAGGTTSCATGSDGNSGWATNWVDAGEGGSTGYCVFPVQSAANTDAEIILDGTTYALRLDDNNVSAIRRLNMSGATKAFLTFSYRRASALTTNEDVLVQLSTNGGGSYTTIYTITGDGNTDAGYVTVYNQDITAYASSDTYLRFLTNNNVDEADYVFIDNIEIRMLKYNQCYIVKLDPASVPANYYTTTVTQRNIVFTNGGTCTSQNDFGIAKNSITISGNVYNDANALKDAVVNGTAIWAPGGSALYAYLIDAAGKVAFKAAVNTTTGDFSFSQADVITTYILMLSTSNVAQFANAPVGPNLPSSWESVGENYGANNNAGSGNEAGTPNTTITVTTALLNVTGIKFGIQRLPDSDNKTITIARPVIGQVLTLNGGINPPVLSGSDPEDCSGGCLLTTKSVIIDQYPSNADLMYNGVLVNDGELINNFNPNLLQVRVTLATQGDSTIIFLYSYVDIAGKKDPAPATYTIYWPIPLPATGLVLSTKLSQNIVSINWKTFSEQNTRHFIIERSFDNQHFNAVGNPTSAAGESVSTIYYSTIDNISGLTQENVIYYRVLLVDLDGHISYSNVVAVRLSANAGFSAWPNPFTSYIIINITTKKNAEFNIKLIDPAGRTLQTNTQEVSKGVSQLSINGLNKLAAGVYLLEISDSNTGNKTIYKFFKE